MSGRLDLSHLERRLDEALSHAAGHRCERFLISSENLGNFSNRQLALHRLMASRFERSRVLYYVRRQDDWIFSSWQEFEHKNGLSLEAWAERCLERHTPRFLATAERLEEAYGAGSLAVIPLHRSAFVGGDLVSDFYRRAGIEMTGGARDEAIHNKAVNPYLIDILARTPSVYESRFETRAQDTKVKSLLTRHVSSPELLFRKHPHFLSDAMRDRILDHFARENEELHRCYFGHLDFDELFGRLPTARDEPGTAEEIEGIKEVLAIQSDLLLQLLKRSEAQAERPSLVGRLKNRVAKLLRSRSR
jgi:hypothetical protein